MIKGMDLPCCLMKLFALTIPTILLVTLRAIYRNQADKCAHIQTQFKRKANQVLKLQKKQIKRFLKNRSQFA